MSVQWERESELAIQAVSAGAELLVGRPEVVPTMRKESLRDVVTEMDRMVERRITTLLTDSPMKYPIVAEESHVADKDVESALASGATWVVDPIDGTANFATGMPLYAISVGLLSHGEPACGAVLLPALRELFFTHGDSGAYMNGRSIGRSASSACANIEDALIVATFPGSKADGDIRKKQYELYGEVNDRTRGCLRLGSAAVAVCYVAASRLQGAYGLGCRIWDIGGPLAIAKRAGCEVVLRRRGTKVDFVVGSSAVVRSLVSICNEKGFLL